MATLLVTQCQRPVGQGGFQTTELRFDGRAYRAVYDCGALPNDPCLEQIDALAAELDHDELDLLTISHLDEDHCNGVEVLLARCGAKTVMLPYLNEVERLVEIAARAAAGRLTGTALEMLTDPARWFRDRGVSEIIEVEPAADDGGEGPAGIVDSPYEPPSGKGPLGTHCRKESLRSVTPDGSRKVLASGWPVLCGESVYSPVWMFLPFAIRGVEPRQQAFIEECRVVLGLPPGPVPDEVWSQALREELKRPGQRRRLARAYDLVASSRNSTSMALYGGPARTPDPAEPGRDAWLGTGDWPLATARRRGQFMRYFDNVAHRVDTFCVPHHGSRHNFPPIDFWHWLDARHAVIAAGQHGEHPHPDVLAKLTELTRVLPRLRAPSVVTDDARAMFVRSYRIEL
jgi:hypothetical protein